MSTSQMSFAQLQEHCQGLSNELAEAKQKLKVYEEQAQGDAAGALLATQQELEKFKAENSELVNENRRLVDLNNETAAELATLKLSLPKTDPPAVP
jgi:chromosome segregation ATPase